MPKAVGDDPGLREMILAMGQEAIDSRCRRTGCRHAVLGPKIGTWDTSGTSVLPFDIHNCKDCLTTKGMRPYDFPQL